ncbi:MAG: sugar ABC transporter permease [Clostridia bacterium]|nr:sugar ABC transporter permease [Clostridia bacterium]
MEKVNSLKAKRVRSFWKQLWYDYAGILYMIPVIIGIVGFTIVPMLTSLNYAFHDYNPYARDPSEQLLNFGFQNFEKIFTKGENGGTLESVMYALYVTFRYSILNILIGIVGSYMLALFLNQQTKGVKIFRVVYYLPVLIPGVAGTLLWKDITAVKGGYLNMIFEWAGLSPYTFYEAKETVLPTLLFIGLFSLGGSTIMWLAQMKNVPTEMYESADLDGANYFQKLFFITIPMTTSMLFYMLIMSTIGGLQAFGNVYPLMDVAGKEVEFIVVQIYMSAYVSGDLSYACALSWFLFVIIGILTAFVFKTSKWVYYGEEA